MEKNAKINKRIISVNEVKWWILMLDFYMSFLINY
jgi:hypothetical protein